MSSQFSASLNALFNAPLPHPHLTLIKDLKAIHPTSQHLTILQYSEVSFPLSGYLKTLSIEPTIVEPDTHSVVQYDQTKQRTFSQVVAGVTTFAYESVEFRAYKAIWQVNHAFQIFYHLVFTGDDDTVGQKLVEEVYRWANSLKEEIWVFEGGCWAKNKQLYKAVRSADWNDIILQDEFKEGLRRDTETFFSSKDVYTSLGITWKRGILLLGPPGNGKTESIKALLSETDCAALYVKSFETRQGPEQGIRAIFEHARQHSPCILVLEDLDAMVKDEVRSFFLNELDGLAQNDGILTIATTNHPERIDDSILNRPSRFDVKYTFKLPDSELRKQFALRWMEKIRALGSNSDVVFDKPDELATSVSEKTEGWSFAFLKELFVSFLLRVAHDKALRQKGAGLPREPSDVLLLKQVEQLAAQIIKSKDDYNNQDKQRSAHPTMFRTAVLAQRGVAGHVEPSLIHAGINF
ncbi:hypothetical protein NM688_g2015 [Phlebia brevispora]|uniref:Uncharacterized protein n=1 Tax=Phlebia brevispora TaxID=194682 RepID=A0ACC1T9Z1_9APHY|nr:hypothetical protein NM688_g2015 [Phlebia brevispora]